MKAKSPIRWLLLLLVVAALVYINYRSDSQPTDAPDRGARDQVEPSRHEGRDDQSISDLFAARRSGVMVQAAGIVEKILPDDVEGSPHQRFIIRLQNDHTLLVSHNIEIAPRVPLAEQDSVELRGQYEWNQRGGVVHWTHHDPDGSHPGGWIRHRGELFE